MPTEHEVFYEKFDWNEFKVWAKENRNRIVRTVIIIAAIGFGYQLFFSVDNDRNARRLFQIFEGAPNIEGVWLAKGGFQPASVSFYSNGEADINYGIFGVDHFHHWTVDKDAIYLKGSEGDVKVRYRLEGETLIINTDNEQWLFVRSD